MVVTQDCTATVVEVAGAKVHVLQGGSGAPLLALHGAGGSQGWRRYHQAWGEHVTVYTPSGIVSRRGFLSEFWLTIEHE